MLSRPELPTPASNDGSKEDFAPADARTLLDLFDQSCKGQPGKTAVAAGGRTLSYSELQCRANQMARYLRHHGVALGTTVAICMERSIALPVCLLGILKASGTYLPLDPEYPAERLQWMLSDSQAQFVITERQFVDKVRKTTAKTLLVDSEQQSLSHYSDVPFQSNCGPENLAYIIYTSGSTGQPKGVMISHGSLLNLLGSAVRCFGLSSSDVLLAISSLSFDIAALDFFAPLLAGAQLTIGPRTALRNLRELQRLISDSNATFLQCTPTTWRMLIDSGWRGANGLKALSGGEPLPRDLANDLVSRVASLWNGYGPTETTVYATIGAVTWGTGIVAAGRAIDNTEIYICDERGDLLPPDELGEVYIGGAGLARGYAGRPDLTAEKFVSNPFAATGSLLYKTGDLGSCSADGTLRLCGRLDDQVKIHGVRIEPGEIEAALRRHSGVRTCAVLPRKGVRSGVELVAYIVARKQLRCPDADELRSHLRRSLPEHMIPGTFLSVEDLPVTPNGKTDRNALAALDVEFSRVAPKMTVPENEIERKLVAIFERVLGIRPIGTSSSFFDLGGHSLLAVSLFSDISKEFGLDLPLATIFESSTVKELARLLCDKDSFARFSAPLVPIKASGSRPPFFCIHGSGWNAPRFRALANLLNPDQPFYALQPFGLDGLREPHSRIEEMAAAYVHEIRSLQPEGPYFLGGWSFGGAVALEMAQQFQSIGQSVGLLVLFDSFFPGRPAHFQKRLLREGWLVRSDRYAGEFFVRKARERLRFGIDLMKYAFSKNARSLARLVSPTLLVESKPHRALANVREANIRALGSYSPSSYAGRVILFWSAEWAGRCYNDTRLGWSDIAEAGLEVHVVPGNHKTILEEPNVTVLASKLSKCIELSRLMPQLNLNDALEVRS